MKKHVITLLKVGISVAIIYYLVVQAQGAGDKGKANVFEQLKSQPKQWGVLVAAWLFCASAVTLTLIRWWYLVRALDLPLRFTEALRIGFLGYLFNLAPLGIVVGDLLKALMLAREHPDQKAKAFATVVVDRVIGLYLLFIVATAAILLLGLQTSADDFIRQVCQATFLLTGLGAVAIAIVLTPGFTDGRGTRALARLPRVGPTIENLIGAVRMYRRKPRVLLVASLMSVGVHSLFATGVYLIARGLFTDYPTLGMHFFVGPLSAATGVIPLSVGPFEAFLDMLYTHVPSAVEIPTGQGFVVALGYRLITVLIAMVGVGYYFSSRREVSQLMHEAEQES